MDTRKKDIQGRTPKDVAIKFNNHRIARVFYILKGNLITRGA